MRIRTSLLCVGAVMAGCQAPEPAAEPPRALAHALGARHAPDAAQPDDPRQLWTCDLGPFLEAGLPNAAWELRGLVDQLLRAHAESTDEREPEVDVDASGHVLRVRAERGALSMARGLIAQLRAETTQPILLDVQLVDVASERLAFLDGAPPHGVPAVFSEQLAADLAAGRATTLTRRQLRLTPGQRASVRETRSRRPVVRIALHGGLPTAEQDTVEDGLVLHATCWLGSSGYALAHVELALQQEASEEPRTLAVGYHRPADGSKGPSDEVVDAAIDLPRLHLAGLRGQLRLPQNRWEVAAAGPGLSRGRRVVALVRARWTQRPSVASRAAAPGTRVLQSLRVALPQRMAEVAEEAATRKSVFFGSGMLGGRTEHVLDGLKNEYHRQQAVSLSNDIGFGRQIAFGSASSLSSRGLHGGPDAGDGWTPLLPETLAAQRRGFESTPWGPGTQLVFAWDQLHVLHDRATTRELRQLIQSVEGWRNQPLHVRAEWVEVEHAELDALATLEGLREALPRLRARRALEAYHLVARSGVWTELSLSESEAVLWGFFGPDRASPETRVVSHGSRLGVRPRRYGDGRLELALRFGHQQAKPATLEPITRAEGWVHKPRFHESAVEQTLAVRDGEPQLLLAESTAAGQRLRALLVTCWSE